MTFTHQVDEISLVTGLIEYTNGIYFRRFHGGIFLPLRFHSDGVTLTRTHSSGAVPGPRKQTAM